MIDEETPDTKHEAEFEKAIKFLRGLYESYKFQRHSEVFKKNFQLENENLGLKKEIVSMTKYTIELQERIKKMKKECAHG